MKNSPRAIWNEQQKKLRISLSQFKDIDSAIDLFLQQHGMLHDSSIMPNLPYHFQDEVLKDFPQMYWRMILPKGEHSLVWLFWHLTRIEDATLSMLVAEEDPLFEKHNWQEKLGISFTDTGNSMTMEEIQQLSNEMNIDALMEYRKSVARHTREIVQLLTGEALRQKVDAEQITRMLEIGVVRASDQGILDYWSRLTKAGVLLMPPTRHTLIHINEAQTLKEKILKFVAKQKK